MAKKKTLGERLDAAIEKAAQRFNLKQKQLSDATYAELTEMVAKGLAKEAYESEEKQAGSKPSLQVF